MFDQPILAKISRSQVHKSKVEVGENVRNIQEWGESFYSQFTKDIHPWPVRVHRATFLHEIPRSGDGVNDEHRPAEH